jgi:hypothetical protein
MTLSISHKFVAAERQVVQTILTDIGHGEIFRPGGLTTLRVCVWQKQEEGERGEKIDSELVLEL